MKLALCVATMRDAPRGVDTGKVVLLEGRLAPGDISLATANAVTNPPVYVKYNTPEDNLGVVKSYDKLYRESMEETLCMVHDDVVIRERGWDARVLAQFEDPSVAICGFGGALSHGTPDLYKAPFKIPQLIRGNYRSAVDDAEVHGERFNGECDIVFADGFFLAIRRSFLDRINGWSFLIQNKIDFIGYDMAICALARRYGYRLRMVGVRAYHRGGGTSVKVNVDRQSEYDYAHKWFYEEFRDCMPAQVNEI